MTVLYLSLGVLSGYLAGSVPWAVITGKVLKGIDIRESGSGNAGATNVYRVLGKGPAVFVLVMDFLKGFLPQVLFSLILPYLSLSAAWIPMVRILLLLGVILGHAFPVWAGFKGGKGVACGAGGISFLFPFAAPVCLLLFILVIKLTHYVSLASLTAAWTLPLLYLLWGIQYPGSTREMYFIFFIAVAMIITILHRTNIIRLLKGTEQQTRFGSQEKQE